MTVLVTDPRLSNLFGPLGPDIRARLQQVLDDPATHWDDAHSIILRADQPLARTLWQAVLAVDPTFPKTGPTSDRAGRRITDWARKPSQILIARALKYAAELPRRRTA